MTHAKTTLMSCTLDGEDYGCIAARDKSCACHLILRETRIVSYAVIRASVGESHLLNITVNPECQMQGLGRRLLR